MFLTWIILHYWTPRHLNQRSLKLELEIHTWVRIKHFLRGENKDNWSLKSFYIFLFYMNWVSKRGLKWTWCASDCSTWMSPVVSQREGLSRGMLREQRPAGSCQSVPFSAVCPPATHQQAELQQRQPKAGTAAPWAQVPEHSAPGRRWISPQYNKGTSILLYRCCLGCSLATYFLRAVPLLQQTLLRVLNWANALGLWGHPRAPLGAWLTLGANEEHPPLCSNS